MAELPEGHRRALLEVAAVLEERRIPFGVGGSCMLALLGLPITVGDLDVLVPVGVEPPDLPWPTRVPDLDPGPISSDWILRSTVSGVPVDLISGMRVDTGNEALEIPFSGGGVADVSGTEVALSVPDAWVALYNHHKPERAALLADHLGR
ncbi:MAG TPA: hypothetical protein VLD62_10250 [Acidimicrobiia bacterium]|nr:hypothetical protein [Acidimicrobiia bacterium]